MTLTSRSPMPQINSAIESVRTSASRVSPSQRRWIVQGVLWALALAVFLIRLDMYRPLTEPIMFHDEAGYLFTAIHFAGSNADPTMLAAPFYHPGYPILIAPIMWISEHPETRYALILGFNALVGALLVPAAYAVARRVFLASSWIALGAAFVVVAYPAHSVAGSLAWADAVIPLMTMLMILAVAWVTTKCSVPAALVTGSFGAWLYLIHPRLIVHGLLLAGLVIILLWQRRCRGRVAVSIVISYGIGFALAQMLISSARESLWVTPGVTTNFMRSLVSVSGMGHFLRNLTGQGWYLLAATFGLAAVGFVYLVITVWQNHRMVYPGPSEADSQMSETITSLYILLLAVGSYALSAAFFIDRLDRIDKLFYGRYSESFLPLLLIAAVVYLARSIHGRRWWIAGVAGVAVAGAALILKYPTSGLPPVTPRNPFLIAALESWRYLLGAWEIPAISVIVIAIAAVAIAVSFRWIAVGLLVIVLAWTVVSTSNWSDWRYHVNDSVSSDYTIDDFLVADGIPDALTYQQADRYFYAFYAYEWGLPITRFDALDDRALETVETHCLLSTRDVPGPGWNLVYAEKNRDAALWTRGPTDGPGVCVRAPG